ncbi:DUF4232 domain-containing protein [Kocuria rhizophila]|uniref:DUF4232 domain-containing protein n=1 Tax=Kocuria rhizophila (strain ATCC 9341 / DSM 348 / NBRC 103217 / DC2201) TaxID=378753 RepID=B2GFH8_KOCRD|nr:DUF4232 domain-containing protein [Kocuria rhizophila]ASE11334.1 DUF4232 domain-containing protein [Kocuria rhizophila]BAG28658.1 hypothetical protein KRH_03110 [Kocuria rhizophila DC2201]VEH76045.1 Uncharacterised protein [Kocuria rhizophila]
MTTSSPDPRGTRKHSRPLLAATALTALLALSACGSSDDSPTTDSTSASASATSASPSASPSASASSSASSSASETPAPSETATAADASQPQPEETRMASAPEVGMPTASPFDKEKADQQGVGGVCSASQLSGTAAPSNGAAGHVIASLTVTNTGSTPCVLSGYPGVSFVDASGAMVGAPASRTESAAAAVTLQPGASTSTSLSITQPGVIGQVCNPHDVTGLRVYPPGSHESLVVSYPGQACGNPKVSQLQVRGFGS